MSSLVFSVLSSRLLVSQQSAMRSTPSQRRPITSKTVLEPFAVAGEEGTHYTALWYTGVCGDGGRTVIIQLDMFGPAGQKVQ